MNISGIEDKIIETIKGLNLFKKVDSLGRKDRPAALSYPSAFAFFVSEMSTGVKSRPVMDTVFAVLVVNKNLASESAAAKDSYTLCDAVRDAIHGKDLGITDIEPFEFISRELIDYDSGVLTYDLRFKTRHFLATTIN
jgi:hypothetical protein